MKKKVSQNIEAFFWVIKPEAHLGARPGRGLRKWIAFSPVLLGVYVGWDHFSWSSWNNNPIKLYIAEK